MRHDQSIAILFYFLLSFVPLMIIGQGLGDPCTSVDGSPTGTTDTCTSGFCRYGICSDPNNFVLVGSPCTLDAQCVGEESANDSPPYCGASFGDQAICGGPSTFCYAEDGSGIGGSPVCASGRCRDYHCTSLDPSPPGSPCQENYDCQDYGLCISGICNDFGTVCLSLDNSPTGDTDDCQSGFCRLGACASIPPRGIGQTCPSPEVCVGAESANETPPGCSGPPGTFATCGGATANCIADNGESSGPSTICASGQCENGSCTKGSPLGVGLPCSDDTECLHGIFCNNGFCTGGELQCTPEPQTPSGTGPSKDCFSGFCRQSVCSNLPVAHLGDACLESRDCAGSDAQGRLLNCGLEKFGVRRCGGTGASCFTDTGALGSAPELCISGQCSNFACVDVAPSPGLGKRVLAQKHLVERSCPAGFEPCRVSSSGFECVDFMNDIESCGGCVGEGLPGVDCSADVHAAEIACVDGGCVVGACDEGYIVAVQNNTCIAASAS